VIVNKIDMAINKTCRITHDVSLKLISEPEDGIAPVRKFMETLLHKVAGK
jgi:hypothetical protein